MNVVEVGQPWVRHVRVHKRRPQVARRATALESSTCNDLHCHRLLMSSSGTSNAASTARASKIARFLAAAIDHLQRRGVADCHVKLENVFILDRTVKLKDLGGTVTDMRDASQVSQVSCAVPDKNVLELDVAVGHASSV